MLLGTTNPQSCQGASSSPHGTDGIILFLLEVWLPQLAWKFLQGQIVSDADVLGRYRAECLSEQVLKLYYVGLSPALEPLKHATSPPKHSNFLSIPEG